MLVEMEQIVILLNQNNLASTLTMLGLIATMQSIASSKRRVNLLALVISMELPLPLTPIPVIQVVPFLLVPVALAAAQL
jgi:uncharacterized membrane protein